MRGYTFVGFVLVITLQVLLTEAQLPPRLNIPGAVLLQPSRPQPAHRQRLHHPPSDGGQVPLRIRKPIPNALPISIPIREDAEEADERPSILDDEVARLSISALQANREPENVPEPPPRPVQFRPERPLPVLRQDLRESASPPPRPFIRQDLDDDDEPIIRQAPQPVRQAPQQVRQHNPAPQPVRQKARVAANPRPQSPQYLDEEDGRRGGGRPRKPQVQILRKYRTDNEDGSITWGFENEDGTFKEENIGVDCVIRGKYGYVDPEGTRREYNYEAGNKCDKPEEEYPLEELPPQQLPSRPSPKKQQYNIPIRA